MTGRVRQHEWGGVSDDPDVTPRQREFARLYRESYGIVYNFVRYRMGDDSVAEDVVSEAFLRAARSFNRFDPEVSRFSTWVVAIATNCMRSHYRRHRPMVDLDEVPEGSFAVRGGEEAYDDRDLVDHLLGSLTDIERELVLMKYREGKRNIDIARELDMNASTVSTKLAKALSKMRAAAEGHEGMGM